MTEPATQPYENNEEHLFAELDWLDLMLRREVLLFRSRQIQTQDSGLHALFVSDAEIDRILGEQAAGESDGGAVDRVRDLTEAAVHVRARIDARKRASEDKVFLALPRLALLFGLTPWEEAVLLICLAPEHNLAYERIYAYLQNDLTRKKPGIDLIMRLLDPLRERRISLRPLFSFQASLFRYRLVRRLSHNEDPLPAQQVRLDDRIAGYLLDGGGMSSEMEACIRRSVQPRTVVQFPETETDLSRVVAAATDHLAAAPAGRKLIVHVHGTSGVGKKTFGKLVCARLGVPVLTVDLQEVMRRVQNPEETLNVILRECLLTQTALYLENAQSVAGEDAQFRSLRGFLAQAIEEYSWLTFIGAEKEWKPDEALRRHLFLTVELQLPSAETRLLLWEALAAETGGFDEGMPWAEAATTYRFTPGQIRSALQVARDSARLRGKHAVATIDDLIQGCRKQSNHRLGVLARKLTPRAEWGDIILPENAHRQLREICAQMKHRRTVYGTWGFGKKLSLGKGLCVLFSGSSGTGKTLAVEVLANELRLEAYKVDLATVVSKYIGETEKNLSKVFEEAETSNAILFFDEADALFGKRSEVKDAHDRYANIEINYLLQRIEEFDGLVILASNLRKNIDDAFFRRMHFAVEFPFPDASYRYRIWQRHLPPEAPVAADIDFDFLANRCILAGGNIKNILVNAAFLAAEDSGVIRMEHVIRAVRREYEKTGRMCTEAEFGSYHAVLRDA